MTQRKGRGKSRRGTRGAHGAARSAALACAVAAAAAWGSASSPVAPAARADVPLSPDAFSAPTEISNPLHPFAPGAVKVYAGTDHGRQVTVVETCLDATREFAWDGGAVTCRVLQEMTFRRGVLLARDLTFLAQSDDGSVWAFGEVSDPEVEADEGGENEDESGGWIVGERIESDPLDTVSVAAPALTMPAQPRVGDTWRPEEAPPEFEKTARAVSLRAVLRTGPGRIADCLRVREIDSDGERETLWYAPGVGLVGSRQPRERIVLRASTFRPYRPLRGLPAGRR